VFLDVQMFLIDDRSAAQYIVPHLAAFIKSEWNEHRSPANNPKGP